MKKIFFMLVLEIVITNALSMDEKDCDSPFLNNNQKYQHKIVIETIDIGRPSDDILFPSCEKVLFATEVQDRHYNELKKIKGVEGTFCALLKNGGIVLVITIYSDIIQLSDKKRIPSQLEGIPTFLYDESIHGKIELCLPKCPKKSSGK